MDLSLLKKTQNTEKIGHFLKIVIDSTRKNVFVYHHVLATGQVGEGTKRLPI